VVGGK
jgi:hypothetical protein